MNTDTARFISEIVRPWETLNNELGTPFALNPEINDYVTRAVSLAVSIKHLPEALQKLKPKDLSSRNKAYEIISDLADSSKHGELRDTTRECKLSSASIYERNNDATVRFLRNGINVTHNNYGKVDFLKISMEAALFIANELGFQIQWTPELKSNTGAFSDKISLHIGKAQQSFWQGMEFQFVQKTGPDEYEPIDLNGTVQITLTSDF